MPPTSPSTRESSNPFILCAWRGSASHRCRRQGGNGSGGRGGGKVGAIGIPTCDVGLEHTGASTMAIAETGQRGDANRVITNRRGKPALYGPNQATRPRLVHGRRPAGQHGRRGSGQAGHLRALRRVLGRTARATKCRIGTLRWSCLQKLLKGEVPTWRRKNVVRARSFAEMLEQTLWRYQNRAIEAAQVIEELIELAKEMREASARGEQLGLSEDELAFYDALEANDRAVKVLGDETLRDIARQFVDTVRNNVTIDRMDSPRERPCKPHADWSAAFFASTATHPTSRRMIRRRCWNRRRSCLRGGRRPKVTGMVIFSDASVARRVPGKKTPGTR